MGNSAGVRVTPHRETRTRIIETPDLMGEALRRLEDPTEIQSQSSSPAASFIVPSDFDADEFGPAGNASTGLHFNKKPLPKLDLEDPRRCLMHLSLYHRQNRFNIDEDQLYDPSEHRRVPDCAKGADGYRVWLGQNEPSSAAPRQLSRSPSAPSAPSAPAPAEGKSAKDSGFGWFRIDDPRYTGGYCWMASFVDLVWRSTLKYGPKLAILDAAKALRLSDENDGVREALNGYLLAECTDGRQQLWIESFPQLLESAAKLKGVAGLVHQTEEELLERHGRNLRFGPAALAVREEPQLRLPPLSPIPAPSTPSAMQLAGRRGSKEVDLDSSLAETGRDVYGAASRSTPLRRSVTFGAEMML